MLVRLIRNNNIKKFRLPDRVFGNYWITDVDEKGNTLDIINVEAINGKWIIKSDSESSIISSSGKIDKCELENNNFYYIRVKDDKGYCYLYCSDTIDKTFKKYRYDEFRDFLIGSNPNNDIVYQSGNIEEVMAKITRVNDKIVIEAIGESKDIYLNSKKVKGAENIKYGDIIFIKGLIVIYMNGFFMISNHNGSLNVNNLVEIEELELLDTIPTEEENSDIIDFFNEEDYFYQSPRFVTSQDKENITIDPPPAKQSMEEMPVFYTVGPMLTMATTSSVTLFTAFTNMSTNGASFLSVLPTLAISVSMLATVLVWPTLTKKYQKKQKIKREKERIEKYSKYLNDKKKELLLIMANQKSTLQENNLTLAECQNIILQKKRKLWEKKIEHDDFLSFRIGMGSVPINANINYPKENFSMEDDELKNELNQVIKETETVRNVPVSFNLSGQNSMVLTGPEKLRYMFLDNILLQLMTFNSSEDLKIVFLMDENNNKYETFKILPHVWDNAKKNRFYATTPESMTELSFYLESVYSSRKYKDDTKSEENTNANYRNFNPYFLLITDDIKKARNLEIINRILTDKTNYGFSVLILNDGLKDLPEGCSNFAFLDEDKCAIVQNELKSGNQEHFYIDTNEGINLEECINKLANIPIKYSSSNDKLPDSIGFLEMYNVGKVEQLNILDRWMMSDPIKSLSAPLGVHSNGELFRIDLHEKIHGPHGLIAGMTGSGKSELIISYVLSMAVNYSPLEVQFALIDYKGGGLTGAFHNEKSNIKLPHLVGTITNLDETELYRSLASVKSELKRRQILFNDARDKLGESTIDIYKYQRLYRDGKVKEPLSHLIIISDEFAELKKEQSDFMDELISTARIGRSLGVHLILATQKPSGVVNDQIWSNSRFRICLKVQEKSDSIDVIKCPDAAALRQAGRFYLQVGYNDYFALGQAAWAGTKYYPTDKAKKKIDKSLSFIDSLGNVIKNIDLDKNIKLEAKGEEITNIVKYLNDLEFDEKKQIKKLWLDPIPEEIFTEELIKKYHYNKKDYIINPVIGELDDPHHQKQHLLTLDLTNNGNTIIYGSAGSGKEILLSSIIYSSITTYNSNEINFYIIDLGSEILGMFKKAPHVGDIVLISETEKLDNLFKLLIEEMNIRKKEFIEYNGDFTFYNKMSGKTKPLITLIINNFDAFNEIFEDFVDLVIQLSREGIRYGIRVIITSTTSSLRYKVVQNFNQSLVLKFNDKSDYSSILGNTHGIYPSKGKGRGLIKINESIHEFQTSYPCKWDNAIEIIKNKCTEIKETSNSIAKSVKVLPNKVTLDIVENDINDIKGLPIGIYKQTLDIAKYNFTSRLITLISSDDMSNMKNFVKNMLNELTMIKNKNILILDTEDIMEGTNCIEKNELFENELDNSLVVFIGFNNFKSSLTAEEYNKLEKKFKTAKDNKNANFVVIDSVENIKKYEYDNLYRNYVNSNYAIWIGNGIADQYVIKIINYDRSLRDDITNKFGYVIEKGIPKLVKLIDFESDEE